MKPEYDALLRFTRWMAGQNPTSGGRWSLAERNEMVKRAREAMGEELEYPSALTLASRALRDEHL